MTPVTQGHSRRMGLRMNLRMDAPVSHCRVAIPVPGSAQSNDDGLRLGISYPVLSGLSFVSPILAPQLLEGLHSESTSSLVRQ